MLTLNSSPIPHKKYPLPIVTSPTASPVKSLKNLPPRKMKYDSQGLWKQIPNLRESVGKSPEIAKREISWDSKVYRISDINSIVHKRYRLLFEHLAMRNKKL